MKTTNSTESDTDGRNPKCVQGSLECRSGGQDDAFKNDCSVCLGYRLDLPAVEVGKAMLGHEAASSSHPGKRLRDRVSDCGNGLRFWLFTNMRGSIRVSINVEQSVALLTCYALIGAGTAMLIGGLA